MIITICFLMLSVALAVAAVRLFLGPTPGDRIIAVDLIAAIVAAGILVHSIRNDSPVFVDVVLVLGLVVFFGTVALARMMKRDQMK